ncbi:MAG: hypothetical protein LBU75_09795 [Desulfovibrio sp.]|nr:hypothetical protein [Desulfovibrio sp.]
MTYGLFTSGLKNADDPRRRKLAGSLEGAVGRARSARTMQDWPPAGSLRCLQTRPADIRQR